MRLLPSRCRSDSCIFRAVACSSTPPRGVTVVNNFDAKRYRTGMRLPVLITVLNVDWKSHRNIQPA